MQKAIRRADAKGAGYWAIELYESNYRDYVWRRLLTISAEDVWGIITHEVVALHSAWKEIQKNNKEKGRIFVAKAVVLLAIAKKSRDADHMTNLVYDAKAFSDAELEAMLEDVRKDPIAIPEYAYDVHTQTGKKRGKTKAEFFNEEHKALNPHEPGLLDDLIQS